MYELKKIGNVFTSKFVGTGPSSYKKRIYRAAVSQRLRNTGLDDNFRLIKCRHQAFSFNNYSVKVITVVRKVISYFKKLRIRGARTPRPSLTLWHRVQLSTGIFLPYNMFKN